MDNGVMDGLESRLPDVLYLFISLLLNFVL